MTVSLTKAAAERIQEILGRTPDSVALRFGVTESGCSGYAYSVATADKVEAGDVVFNSHGVDVVVDKSELSLVEGTEIDYVSEGLNQTFKFSNPRATGECGCGESFAVAAQG